MEILAVIITSYNKQNKPLSLNKIPQPGWNLALHLIPTNALWDPSVVLIPHILALKTEMAYWKQKTTNMKSE